MKLRLLAVASAAALILSASAFAATASAQSSGTTDATAQATAGIPIPINFTSALGSFQGTFTLERFAAQGGQLVAVGTLTGTVRDALGNVVGTVDQALTIPVAAAQGTCQILHLELGPIDLNLLGLHVTTNRIVLDITAEQGPGNLLGNLLCSVAHLLDSQTSPNALARLLNQILGLLG